MTIDLSRLIDSIDFSVRYRSIVSHPTLEKKRYAKQIDSAKENLGVEVVEYVMENVSV